VNPLRVELTLKPGAAHTQAVTPLGASLPDGSALAGPAAVEVLITRGVQAPRVEFLVKLEKRPEVRKVFPPKPPQPPSQKAARKRGGSL
jgi:hypothetical protein